MLFCKIVFDVAVYTVVLVLLLCVSGVDWVDFGFVYLLVELHIVEMHGTGVKIYMSSFN